MSTHDAMAQQSERVSLADEEGVKHVLVNAILGLWDVVNNLTRLQPSRRDRYHVTIFGSARVQAHVRVRRDQEGRRRAGRDGLRHYHWGGPGLMQAANEGAATAPERAQSVGIRVDLPFEQDVNAFVTEAFSIAPSSRACTSLCSPPTPSSLPRAASARSWKRC